MAAAGNWAFPDALQPDPARTAFELDAALDAVVLLRAEIPADAFTAPILGTERAGNGVVIGADGLVLTIGYLITEASSIWLTTNRGSVVQGHALAYDQATGFGLVMPLGQLGVRPLARGSASSVATGDTVIVIGQGGREHSLNAKIVAKREFAGYWEYVLDEALFTAPAHPQWGGAALVGADGRLLGIGSLLVQEAVGGKAVDGNMFVPIDLLEPILKDMLSTGCSAGPTLQILRNSCARLATGVPAASRIRTPSCTPAISAGPPGARPPTTTSPSISVAYKPSHARVGPADRPVLSMSFRIGSSKSIGTNMLPSTALPPTAS